MNFVKSLIRILREYKLYLFVILFCEFFYYLKNYKGFNINYSNNTKMADNIPCPYYFLFKIKKVIKFYKFKSLIDLGCGSGRIIDFINNNFDNKKICGVEFFNSQYQYCKKVFKYNKNIKVIKSDFTKLKLSKINFDVIFISAPFNNKNDFKKFMNTLCGKKLFKKKIFIIINYDYKLIKSIKRLKFIDSFYFSKEKGYSICLI